MFSVNYSLILNVLKKQSVSENNAAWPADEFVSCKIFCSLCFTLSTVFSVSYFDSHLPHMLLLPLHQQIKCQFF